ncbi:TPA: hypothetical protein DIC20_01450 [Candidatus Dependentiae bacterium]|nr:hypothetical protein [Candidatus Dependentiae bacterium]HCU00351.1 hypothetical protein [Candidatus Dependentiae bacterium]
MKRIVNLCLIFLGVNFCFADDSIRFIKFDNKTDVDYVVYERQGEITGAGGPVFTAESAGWRPVLLVKAHEEGETDVLVRDNEGFGSQIKLEPLREDLQPIYFRAGIKTSGDCIDPWFSGPYSINIALNETDLISPFKDYDKVKRVRCCVYRTGNVVVEIYPDGIKLVNFHNIRVLDPEKVDLRVLKME